MKRIPFPLNDNNFIVEFHKTREGPSGFMCYYKNAATYRLDPLDAWRTLGIAKNTDTGKALKEWCLDCHDKYVSSKLEPVKDTSFASDVMEDVTPTDNTKMIT